MRYQGPIYRPPSEADSLLVQATLGCPHNKCTFCLVYKKGPRFAIRPVPEIVADLAEGARDFPGARTLFLPAGNSLAMPTADLAQVCVRARELLPRLTRITSYASFPSLAAHGPTGLAELAAAGLSRVHVGLESGFDPVLAAVKKGFTQAEAIGAGRLALTAGLELNLYVILGLGGPEFFREHALATAEVLNQLTRTGPLTLRLRTLVPKVNTLLLHQIRHGRFSLASVHQVLAEAGLLLRHLNGPLTLTSDHYTNYLDLAGQLPMDRERLLALVERARALPAEAFRPDFIGRQ
ncbi:MAG: radical SAM protein [Deltaproteobacteria bacterium]|nr:radical SAM protein [Deltaproteobacteria bacterium]